MRTLLAAKNCAALALKGASVVPGRITTAMGIRRASVSQLRQRWNVSRLSLPISQTKRS